MPEYTIAPRERPPPGTSKPDAATGPAQLTWAHRSDEAMGLAATRGRATRTTQAN
jgi:hypothetical protein